MNASYLAGLIDARGYIGITMQRGGNAAKGGSYRLTVAVRMADRRVLDRAQTLTGFGTIVRKAPVGDAIQFGWSTWAQRAGQVLLMVRPYLIAKGEQCGLALEFQNGMRRTGSAGLTESERERRQHLAEAIKAINNKENHQ